MQKVLTFFKNVPIFSMLQKIMNNFIPNFCSLIALVNGITLVKEAPESDILDQFLVQCSTRGKFETLECLSEGLLDTLRVWDDNGDIEVGNIRLEKDEKKSRDVLDVEYEGKNFGSVLAVAGKFLERRRLQWRLDFLYPGLEMKVGPSLDGNGVLEFGLNQMSDERLGIGEGVPIMGNLSFYKAIAGEW